MTHTPVPSPEQIATPPLISVVIPTLNRPELLTQRAIPSALSQNYANLEVLVVTDGPDPATQAVLGRITDPRLRALSLPENRGPSDVRNFAVQQARGEYIAFLDDDDEWKPNKLARQMELVQAAAYAFPVAISPWITRMPSGDTLNPPRLKEPGERIGDYINYRRSPKQPECGVTCSMILAPRELLLDCPFSTGMRNHEDWDWLLRVEQRPGVGFVQLPREAHDALTIYYHTEDRPFTSRRTVWPESLAWAEGHRQAGRLSDRAFAGFIIVQLAPFAAVTGDLRGLRVLGQALRSSHANLYEWLRFLKLWAIPAPLRRRIRQGLNILRPTLRNLRTVGGAR